MNRSNVVTADVSLAVAMKASEIRSMCLTDKLSLKTVDAQILATAILFKADVLHSTDKGLLRLNGKPCAGGVPITLPQPLGGALALYPEPG